MPFLSLSLLARLVRKEGANKTNILFLGFGQWILRTKWTSISSWAVVGWTHECWGHWGHCKATPSDLWLIMVTGRGGPGDPNEHQVLNMHQQWALAAKNFNGNLHYRYLRSIVSRSRVMIPSIQHWGRHTWSAVSSAGSAGQDRYGHTVRVPWRVTNMLDCSISSRRKGWESWDYSWWAKEGLGECPWQRGTEPGPFQWWPVTGEQAKGSGSEGDQALVHIAEGCGRVSLLGGIQNPSGYGPG